MELSLWTTNLHLLLLLCLLSQRGSARSSGAPNAACASMAPSHKGNPARKDNGEFGLVLDIKEDKVVVTLQGNKGKHFKGFMIQARNTSHPEKMVGTFEDLNTHTRFMKCGDPKNSVTHRDSKKKSSLTVTWRPPSGYEGEVVFKFSVVEDFAKFWVGLESKPVPVVATRGLLGNRANNLVQIVCSACPPWPNAIQQTGKTTTKRLTTTTRRPTTMMNLLRTTMSPKIVFNPLPAFEGEVSCDSSSVCTLAYSCQWYLEQVEQIEGLERSTQKYQEVVKELKQNVCNKDQKMICCPLLVRPLNSS